MTAPLAELQALERDYAIGTYVRQPVQFVRGEGVCLWDEPGQEYLDFLAGISVLNVGHCHPRVAAVREQVGRSPTPPTSTTPSRPCGCRPAGPELAGRQGVPVQLRRRGGRGGDQAARRAKAQGEIVVMRDGFHGAPTVRCRRPRRSKQAPFAPLVPALSSSAKDPEALAAAVGPQPPRCCWSRSRARPGSTYSPPLLAAARHACDRTGAALIFDEIQTGMGRTGTLWAYEQTGVVPDALTSAKALGGGLPIGALVTGPRLADTFQPGDHGSTFAGGPLVASAALVALEICSDQRCCPGRELGERLGRAWRSCPGSAVRGQGLMIGIDLATDPAPELARRALLEHRLVINATGPDTIRLEPPLIVASRRSTRPCAGSASCCRERVPPGQVTVPLARPARRRAAAAVLRALPERSRATATAPWPVRTPSTCISCGSPCAARGRCSASCGTCSRRCCCPAFAASSAGCSGPPVRRATSTSTCWTSSPCATCCPNRCAPTSLRAHGLAHWRLAAHGRRSRVLASRRASELLSDWEMLLETLVERPLEDRPAATQPIGETAGRRIRKAYPRRADGRGDR